MANDLYSPSTCKPTTTFTLYDLSFILSFIFFSPYILKFFFFISPLFFTTSILILISLFATTFPHSNLGILQTMVEKLRSKLNQVHEDGDDELFLEFEDLDIYKIVFHDHDHHDHDLSEVDDDDEDNAVEDKQMLMMENSVTVSVKEVGEERRMERLFEELDQFDEEAAGKLPKLGLNSGEDKKVDESSYSEKSNPWSLDSSSSHSFTSCESMAENKPRLYTDKVMHKLQTSDVKPTKAMEMHGKDNQSRVKELLQKYEATNVLEEHKSVQHTLISQSHRSNSLRSDSSTSFTSYGSMRKEKEWKRTLACKLFEERNNSSGGEEGMDSLWEAYEDENAVRKPRSRKEFVSNKQKMVVKNKKKGEVIKLFDDGEEEEDEDDDEEFMSNGQLCCLKALKLSTGKMNLGMGKPNLVKISKAIKGFGWLHHVGSSKHGKRN